MSTRPPNEAIRARPMNIRPWINMIGINLFVSSIVCWCRALLYMSGNVPASVNIARSALDRRTSLLISFSIPHFLSQSSAMAHNCHFPLSYQLADNSLDTIHYWFSVSSSSLFLVHVFFTRILRPFSIQSIILLSNRILVFRLKYLFFFGNS